MSDIKPITLRDKLPDEFQADYVFVKSVGNVYLFLWKEDDAICFWPSAPHRAEKLTETEIKEIQDYLESEYLPALAEENDPLVS